MIGQIKHASAIINSVGVENLKDEAFKTYVGLIDCLFGYHTFKKHIEQLSIESDDVLSVRLINSKIKVFKDLYI